MFSLVSIARDNPKGTEGRYEEEILKALSYYPVLRVAINLQDNEKHYLASLLQYYARFLEFMADQKRRKHLDSVNFENRKDFDLPYLQMKLNSDMLHSEIIQIINSIDQYRRNKLFNWFLL